MLQGSLMVGALRTRDYKSRSARFEKTSEHEVLGYGDNSVSHSSPSAQGARNSMHGCGVEQSTRL